jgi:ABC-2 type transport system permease protein
MNHLAAAAALPEDAVVLEPRSALRPLLTLFTLTLRQYVRGRRLLVLSLLFALPGVLAVVVCLTSRVVPPADNLEFALLLNLIPHTLAPLAALLYASGVIRDDVEEQTLTYLLLRPLPRWGIYLVKLGAALFVTSVLTAVFTLASLATIHLMAGESLTAETARRGVTLACAMTLTQVGYCGLFGLLGLLMRRSLLAGVAYIVLFEGLLAAFDTVARRLTVMYYFRVLVLRWLSPSAGYEWSIDLTTAPGARACISTLLIAGLVLGVVGAVFFARREFLMKTPEGN